MHGLLLLLSLVILVTTLFMLKQRAQPLFENSKTESGETTQAETANQTPPPEPRKPRVSVIDDRRAWINERKELKDQSGELVP